MKKLKQIFDACIQRIVTGHWPSKNNWKVISIPQIVEAEIKRWVADCPHTGVDAQYCNCNDRDYDSVKFGYELAMRTMKNE